MTLALLYTVLTFGALTVPSPAEARGKAVYYTAELAAPAKEARTIIKGMVWHCEGTSCRAAKGNSRPVMTCKRLANKLGEVTAFTAKGEELVGEKLAKCNG
ncbi:hypothetical protein GRI41_12865 [Altererythrobacter aquaemixtae]|uniref:Uncharacterized protein n=1 Tax=Pontixanthobacter aquaemixtae TaxID=1958940 RepID=A0A844ZTT3_9SPHN|nr:hypothetical protein [Pontixanthobacter aquaemixtae]